jgi:RNA polymerase sigma-54 factor
MKKTISLILVTLVLVSMLMLTACSSEKAVVESVFTIDGNYVGQRTITVKYPLDTHIDSLEKKLEAKNPLTDSDLMDKLKEQGFTMARRTVAKYREHLHIPVARLRKE